MAIEIITAIIRMTPDALTPSERLVLLVLAWHADKYGLKIWPAVSTISRETSLSRRSVQYVLARLRDKGFLLVEGMMARGSIRYAIDLSTLDRAPIAQSGSYDCAPIAQSEAATRDSDGPERATIAHRGAPTAPLGVQPLHGGGATVAPDPSCKRPLDPSLKKYLGAEAPRVCPPAAEQQEAWRVASSLCHDVINELGDSTPIADIAEHLERRLTEQSIVHEHSLVIDVVGMVTTKRRLYAAKRVHV